MCRSDFRSLGGPIRSHVLPSPIFAVAVAETFFTQIRRESRKLKTRWRITQSWANLSLLKILSEQKSEQVRKPKATSHDEPTRAAGCTICGCRVDL